MAETTELIKEKLDVGDFIKQYVELQPAGKNLKGRCPFHKEKTPSFIVSPDKGIWHCFGCGLGGDVITFLMKYENLEFLEALKILADKAGIDLKISGSHDQKQYNVLFDINRLAVQYFVAALNAEPAARVREYLKERGLTKETIEEFEIGLSGSQPDALIRFLTKKGFSVQDVDRAGLAYKSERGTYRDRFTNRIMFPLYNTAGKAIGFTARVLPWNDDKTMGKYINTPETSIFNKSKLLFGFSNSKNFIREANAAVLVEGQMDFLMIWQDGIKNAIATSGTALTAEHLKVLRRLCESVVLSFDNDGAGRAAAERTIDLAEANDFAVKVLTLDDKELKDPADIVRAKPGYMAELISRAKPAMEYYFDYYGVASAKDIQAKKKAVRSALSKIKQVSSPIERDHWLKVLSQQSRIEEKVLELEMATLKTEAGRVAEEERAAVPTPELLTRQDVILQRLLSLGLIDGRIKERVEGLTKELPEVYQALWGYLCGKIQTVDAALKQAGDLIQLRGSVESTDPEKILQEGEVLVAAWEAERQKGERRRIQEEIKQAEASGDQQKVARLLEVYRDLTHKK